MYTVFCDAKILKQLQFSKEEIDSIDIDNEQFKFSNLTVDDIEIPKKVTNLEILKIVHSNLLPVWIVDPKYKESTVFTPNLTTELLFRKLIELDNSTCFLLKQQDEDRWFLFYITVEESKIVVKSKRLINLNKLNSKDLNNKIYRLGQTQLKNNNNSNEAIFIDDIDEYIVNNNMNFSSDRSDKGSVLDKVINKRTYTGQSTNSNTVPSPNISSIDRSLERLIVGELKIRNLDQTLDTQYQRQLIDILIKSVKFKFRSELYNTDNNSNLSINLLDIDKIFEFFDEMFKALA